MSKKIIKDRFDYILKYIKGKKVLNLGCVNGYDIETKYTPWFYGYVVRYAKICVGLDIDKSKIKEVEKITKTKIHHGNIENYDLKEKFDVVIAGNIIEHISDFKGFFNSSKKHMDEDSVLIITVPNAFNILNTVRSLLLGRVVPDPDHVVFFDVFTLHQLLKRNGFKMVKYHYQTQLSPQRVRNTIVRIFGAIIPIYNLNLMVVAKISKGDSLSILKELKKYEIKRKKANKNYY